jgi:hypothetical protein
MRARADQFVKTHLVPLFHHHVAGTGGVSLVVVVSHGILLNSLLRVLLMRFAPTELSRLAAPGPGPARPEYLASWSNTGYLEIAVRVDSLPAPPSGGLATVGAGSTADRKSVGLAVVRVNEVGHLEGLRKTRGGIGSAQFDRRQKTMDSYFKPTAKKRKAEDEHSHSRPPN